MRNNYTILIIGLLMTVYCSWSQEYKFQHFSSVDGISHNEVRKIIKDDKGFFWFGTQNGLNRYDGYRFKRYKHIPDDNTSIIGDKIYALTSSEDKLWVGTLTGLSVINTITLEVIPTPNILKSVENNSVYQLFCDGSNNIWMSTKNNNYTIDAESLEINPILQDYNIACVAKGLGKYYWIGTDKGLLQYDLENARILKTYDIGSFDYFGLNKIHSNSYGEVWITIGDKILRYQSERDRFIEVYSSNSLNSISENRDGDIFFGSYGDGLLKYSRATGLFEPIIANPSDHHSISSNDVYDVYVDEENIVWVGTQEGLDYYDYSRHRFNSLIHLPESKNSLRSSFVQTMFQDKDGNFWIGTREGIDCVDFKKGYTNPKITHINMESKGFELLNSSYISSIFRDSKERLWIATMSNGLFMTHEKSNTYKHFTHRNNDLSSIASSSVRAILEDHLGRMWFGTGAGLSLLQEDTKSEYSFENLGYTKFNTKSIPLNDIYSLFEDSKNRIWIGMNDGGIALLQEQGEGKSFMRFKHMPSNPESLSNDEVFVIYEDSEKQVWFGTSAGGINLLREDGNPKVNNGYYFKSYTELDGLSDNEINAILEDDESNLWIATNTGFSKFNPKEETFTNYSTYDGVLKGKFRKNAKWKTVDGTLFFGGAAGINYFNPNKFKLNETIPKPVFVDLIIDGKVINVGQILDDSVIINKPLSSGSVIQLPKNDNRFEIEFASLTFSSPYRNKYAYKLEGKDEDWRHITGKDPIARYSRLQAGNYRLYLKASNNDGIWNENPIYVDIKVRANFLDKMIVKIGFTVLLLISLIFGTLGLKKFKNRDLNKLPNPKVKKSPRQIDPNLEKENLAKIEELNHVMNIDKIYLDSKLGLAQLAEKIEISNNHLSFLLNEYIGKNFYDYINYYRVEEVKKRLKDPNYKRQTLSSIGGDCGFNSKSAFNRIFKNLTGKTPNEYQNIHWD
ncbi:AraC family transcriptional regulator [Arenibacter certesii]|uniref:HTH araC/xylS-type domain-containing protein n=1 Tax=Arenibacter certesii TaxID=228955 RepID=A0A918MNH3_9FLAO|nr:two-component regulator propeller domain-containing protein [Arenibacter certesii]GGW39518.1 hypothetical protein GCM10007383_25340 [Arenibacter certesii]